MAYEDNLYDPNTPLFADEEELGALPGARVSGSPLSAYLSSRQNMQDILQKNLGTLEKGLARLEARKAGPSRSESLLQLAAVLGQPTRTGSFGETLGNVASVLAQQSAAKRKEEAERDALVEQYRMKMGEGQLKAAEGQAETAAGLYEKELKAGRVTPVGQPQNIDGKNVVTVQLPDGSFETRTVPGPAPKADLTPLKGQTFNGQPVFTSKQGGLFDAQGNPLTQVDKPETKLTNKEIDILTGAEQGARMAQRALNLIDTAIQNNEQAWAGSLADWRKTAARLRGSEDSPEYLASEALTNALDDLALTQLKETFPGAISNKETDIIREVQGAKGMSRAARKAKLERAERTAMGALQYYTQQINKVKQREYTKPSRAAAPAAAPAAPLRMPPITY